MRGSDKVPPFVSITIDVELLDHYPRNFTPYYRRRIEKRDEAIDKKLKKEADFRRKVEEAHRKGEKPPEPDKVWPHHFARVPYRFYETMLEKAGPEGYSEEEKEQLKAVEDAKQFQNEYEIKRKNRRDEKYNDLLSVLLRKKQVQEKLKKKLEDDEWAEEARLEEEEEEQKKKAQRAQQEGEEGDEEDDDADDADNVGPPPPPPPKTDAAAAEKPTGDATAKKGDEPAAAKAEATERPRKHRVERKSEQILIRKQRNFPRQLSKDQEKEKGSQEERERTRSQREVEKKKKKKLRLEDIGELNSDGSRTVNYKVCSSSSSSQHDSSLLLLLLSLPLQFSGGDDDAESIEL
jgi:hypothetical protein